MGERAEIACGIDGSGEIGGGAKSNQTSFVGELALEIVDIKGAVIRVDGNFADGYPGVVGGKLPW